jgi:hypothetical protein
MMNFTKDDFIAWRRNPVTEGFLEEVVNEMNSSVADLVVHAGVNPPADRFNCGKIEGLRWLTDWQPDFREREETDELGDSGT